MPARWSRVRENLEKKVAPHSFQMWLDGLIFSSFTENCVFLSCPNEFLKKRILSSYKDLLSEEIKAQFGVDIFELAVKKTSTSPTEEALAPLMEKSEAIQLALPGANGTNTGCFLQRNFTFDQFVVGNCNNFAYTAAKSLATDHLKQQAVFLLSVTGMGKSHLSHAVGNYILAVQPTKRVYYTTAQDFTNEMCRSFKSDTFTEFSDKYRKNCDVLLLEDVHVISGDRTQIELTRTLDFLYNAGKKIIFTSTYLPTEIPKLNAELHSRLSWGIISRIESPEFKTRVRIIKRKCRINNYLVPEEVVQYLASELVENIRQLENGLSNVVTHAYLLNQPVTVTLAETVVNMMIRNKERITIGAIQKLVCKQYRITKEELVSNSRKKEVLLPRQIAMYLARKYTDQSLQAIGKSFNRYHATTIHAISHIEKELIQDAQIQNQVRYLSEKLNAL